MFTVVTSGKETLATVRGQKRAHIVKTNIELQRSHAAAGNGITSDSYAL